MESCFHEGHSFVEVRGGLCSVITYCVDPHKQKVDKNTCYFCKIKARYIVYHTLGLFFMKGSVCLLEF